MQKCAFIAAHVFKTCQWEKNWNPMANVLKLIPPSPRRRSLTELLILSAPRWTQVSHNSIKKAVVFYLLMFILHLFEYAFSVSYSKHFVNSNVKPVKVKSACTTIGRRILGLTCFELYQSKTVPSKILHLTLPVAHMLRQPRISTKCSPLLIVQPSVKVVM